MKLSTVRKALAAAFAAGLAALTQAAVKGAVSSQDWYVIVGAALVAGTGVFLIPNAPAAKRPS